MATIIKSAVAEATVGKPSIVELKPYLQPFPYGREGYDSMAARFAKEAIPSTIIKEDQPYGEIWLGSTHKNGPSSLMVSNPLAANIVTLRDLIYSDPKFYLGSDLLNQQDLQEMYKEDLPFLFKILSFDKALPLQAHPDPKLGSKLKKRELADQWYNSDFVDKNGKPEVSVALSDFSAYIGFRPPAHILAFVKQVPEFAALLSDAQIEELSKASTAGDRGTEQSRDALKSIFGTLIGLDAAKVKRTVLDISQRIQTESPKQVFGNIDDADELARLWKANIDTYGSGDIGVIVTTFCMNLLQLKKGEGCWILADDIHAYAQGDVIECMANSDNMVCHGLGETEQGGLKTFVDMLSYRHLPANKLTLDVIKNWDLGTQSNTTLYKVPIEEFDLLSVVLSPNDSKETLALPGPHTFVVTEGKIRATVGQESILLPKGHTAFVAANAQLELSLEDGDRGEIWGSFYQRKPW